MEFSTYLTEARSRAGISRRELARRVGVSNQHLCNIEKGKFVPSEALCQRIAATLQLNSDVILLRAGHIPPDILQLMRRFPKEACAIIRGIKPQ